MKTDNFYQRHDEDGNMRVTCSKKAFKINNDPTKHYPNKNEAHVMRKIKSKTGLSEEEIHSIKKHRIQLSKAQDLDQKAKRAYEIKIYSNLIKEACQKTGLVPSHPETLKILQEILNDEYLFYNLANKTKTEILSAEQVVKQYTKNQ